MKKKFSTALLFIVLSITSCIQTTATERRVVELPKEDPRTSLSTCQKIVQELVASGLQQRITERFPNLTEAQKRGIFINWNEGVFQTGKSVFIMAGIQYQGEFNEAKEIADFLKAEATKAVETYFSKSPHQ